MSFLSGFKKTANPGHEPSAAQIIITKPKLKFNPKFKQLQFEQYVLLRSDHIPSTGYAVGQPKDFNWHYDPKFSLAFSHPIKKDWKTWFLGEQEEWVYNHGLEERKDHFEKWGKAPEKKPIILVEGTDGKLHIWDGHHRTAFAHILGWNTVPAIVGKRKGKKK